MNQNEVVKAHFAGSRKPGAIMIGFLIAIVFVGVVRSADFSSAGAYQDELQVELTGSGFVPGAVQHAAGTVAIAVENFTLPGPYTLLVKAADGTVLKEIEVQKGSAAWTMTLQAGQYALTEVSHPQWSCQITIQ